MWKRGTLSIAAALLLVALTANVSAGEADDSWPNWRGPNADGVAVNGDPPTTWSETENIKWKLKLPGSGQSTPVVWGNKMFILVAGPTSEEPPKGTQPEAEAAEPRRGPPRGPSPTVPWKFDVVCLDVQTGETIWQRTATEAVPHEGHHPTGSFAPYSAITDGEHVWASFGSRGLYCYDLDGTLQWNADLIVMTKKLTFGEGSSPALAGDAIVVVLDHEGDSKIVAFNKVTGELLWETPREERTTWATPFPVQVGDRLEIITSATRRTRSYDAQTGELIWECSGQTLNAIPTPVAGFGYVFCTSGFRGNALQAIKLGHKGDISRSDAVAWQVNEDTPYVASPLLYGDRIYLTSGLKAVLSCYDAKTGKPYFVGQKLEGLKQIYASPIGAGDHVYIPDRNGNTMVVKKSDTFEVIATNTLDDGFDASPIVIGDALYLKGNEYLYCISKS